MCININVPVGRPTLPIVVCWSPPTNWEVRGLLALFAEVVKAASCRGGWSWPALGLRLDEGFKKTFQLKIVLQAEEANFKLARDSICYLLLRIPESNIKPWLVEPKFFLMVSQDMKPYPPLTLQVCEYTVVWAVATIQPILCHPAPPINMKGTSLFTVAKQKKSKKQNKNKHT